MSQMITRPPRSRAIDGGVRDVQGRSMRRAVLFSKAQSAVDSVASGGEIGPEERQHRNTLPTCDVLCWPLASEQQD